jgi:hypothetical protein
MNQCAGETPKRKGQKHMGKFSALGVLTIDRSHPPLSFLASLRLGGAFPEFVVRFTVDKVK